MQLQRLYCRYGQQSRRDTMAADVEHIQSEVLRIDFEYP